MIMWDDSRATKCKVFLLFWAFPLTGSFCCWASLWWLGWSPSLRQVCLWLAVLSRFCLSQGGLLLTALPLGARCQGARHRGARHRGVLHRWLALLLHLDAPSLGAHSSPSAPSSVVEASSTAEPPAGQPAGSWSWVSCGWDCSIEISYTVKL